MPPAGAFALTVVCKATFRLAPDVSPLAEEQEPIFESDAFQGGEAWRSLVRATDLAPFKRHAEVLLVGHAYAPRGVAVGGLVARLTVAEIDKAIDVSGDRYLQQDGFPSHPGRFVKMPLVWERAAGGPDTSNPVGVPMGDEARADGWGRVPLPNLVPTGRTIGGRGDVVPPACFAPMSPHWPQRLARLHRHAASFRAHPWSARPLPPDIDAAYFNAAPQDQLVRELIGTERLTLENLHPQHALLTTRLARVTPRATVDWGGGHTNEVKLVCDTLLVDTDRGVATTTYRGQLALDHPERPGWVIFTSDVPDRPDKPSLPAWAYAVKDASETVTDESAAPEPPAVLPFGSAPAAKEAPAVLPFGSAPAAKEAPAVLPFGSAPAAKETRAVLPLASAPAAKGAPAVLPPAASSGGNLGDAFDEEETHATAKADAPARAWSAAPAPVAIVAAPAVPAGAGIEDAETVEPGAGLLHEIADDPSTVRPPTRAATLPFAPRAASPPVEAPAPVTPYPRPPVAAPPPPPIAAPVAAPPPPPIAAPVAAPPPPPIVAPVAAPPREPPRVGPLATPDMVAADMQARGEIAAGAPEMAASPAAGRDERASGVTAPASAARSQTSQAPGRDERTSGVTALASAATSQTSQAPGRDERASGTTALASAATSKTDVPLPLDDYPLERCARIDASIGRARARASEILKEHKLDRATWEALRAHWAEQIKQETARGKTALLRAYDAAFVAQVEDERGPIAIEEYARIVVAVERGTTAATLAELRLPEGSMVRVQRVWMGKIGKDPELRRLVRAAVLAAGAS
jgi:hypothetical protein